MAKKSKEQELTHCRVVFTTHPNAPWRVIYPVEVDGKTVVNRWLVADGFPQVSLELIAGKMNTLKIARPGKKNKKDRN